MIKIIVIATTKSMVTLNIENLPDEIMGQIQTLARQQNRTINEQAILMLQEAAEKQQTLVGSGISPENHPSFEDRRQALAEDSPRVDVGELSGMLYQADRKTVSLEEMEEAIAKCAGESA